MEESYASNVDAPPPSEPSVMASAVSPGMFSRRPSYRLRHEDVRRILHLVGDIRDLQAEPMAQHRRLVDGLCDLVGADQAFSYTVADFRPGGSPHFTGAVLGSHPDPLFHRYLGDFTVTYPLVADPFAGESIAVPGVQLQVVLSDMKGKDDRAFWRRYPDFHDLTQSAGVTEGVVCFRRSQPGGAAYLPWAMRGVGIHRLGGSQPYSERDRTIIDLVVEEVDRLTAAAAMRPVESPLLRLTRRQQQMLQLLVAGQAPKQIARQLNLSTHTVRDHIKQLYRRTGVSGRDELVALFTARWDGGSQG